MTGRSLEAVVRALNTAQARYLIVGGLAVVAHGYVRFTADLDLVIDLDEGNLNRALGALRSLGYRPRAPVALEDFVDPENRRAWRNDRHMTVFSLYSPEHAATEVDLFVEAPFDFEAVYARAARLEIAPGLPATFIGFDDLLALKEAAGRPQDQTDVRRLRAIREPGDES